MTEWKNLNEWVKKQSPDGERWGASMGKGGRFGKFGDHKRLERLRQKQKGQVRRKTDISRKGRRSP